MDGERDNKPVQHSFAVVYRAMSAKRRRQLYLSMLLMVLGAFAELLTIGAVLPLLTLTSAPERIRGIPVFIAAVKFFGFNSRGNLALAATVLLVVVAVTTAIIRLTLTWVSQAFVFRLGHDIAVTIYSRVLRQPYGHFIKRNSSEVLAGVEKVQAIIFNILLPLIQGFISAVIGIFIIAVMFAIDSFVASAAAAALGLVYLSVTLISRNRLRTISSVMSDRTTRRIQQLQEGVGGIRDILLDQSQDVFLDQFRKLDGELRDAQAVSVFIGAAPRFVVESAGVALIAVLAYHMSFQPGGLIAAVPVLGALALAAQRLLPLLQLTYYGWTMFVGNRDNLLDVAALLEAPVLTLPARRIEQPVPFRRSIVLRDLSFSYSSDAPALHGLNLRLDKGTRVGFIGKTGSGKSTLLDMIMGLLEPTGGAVEIDGIPLLGGNVANWQAQVAHVPQSIYLTDRSIASNIAFGQSDGDVDIERVHEAARKARIHNFIETLPDGYQTRAGERGVRLSGGQRQRIGIARALYKRASVLVFDEATSALDDDTERAVMKAISGLDRELTVLMIAHRLSTVAACDRVIRLDDGQVTADGSYHDVVAKRDNRKTA